MLKEAQAILNPLAGKKTYTVCALIGVLLFGSWQKWWFIPGEVYQGLLLLAVLFIKAGVNRELRAMNGSYEQLTSGGGDKPSTGAVSAAASKIQTPV